MAANVTTGPSGLLGFVVDDVKQSPGNYLIALGVLLVSVLLHKLSTPSLDPREPPFLKSAFPIIGHFYGMMKYQNTYLKRL
jgi:hypothetical protein